MSESRIFNSRRNLISGMVKQLQAIVMPFIIRTIVLYTMGLQYQGLSSLFNSVLNVLNLADLGFSIAVTYILYQPIAEQDWDGVCAIAAFLRRAYHIIGLVILVIGLAILPLLPKLIFGTYPADVNIFILYLFYLLNTILSYWLFAYKGAVLTAYQRDDLVSNVHTITSLCLRITQIIILVVLRDYYLFVAVQIIFTVLNNVLLQFLSRKYFPCVIPKGKLPEKTRKDLIRNVKAIFINKAGDVARNGCDSIFLSAFLGLTTLAIYDNYYYVYTAVYSVSLVITHAIQASVGNSVAVESVEKNYRDLNKFNFLFSWFTGWCCICLCCLYQPFMIIWMNGNKTLLLSTGNMLLFCLYFYAITMNNVRNLYINASGIYWELRAWFILEAAGNIILNALFGYFWGISGIVAATIVTVFIFNFLSRTNVLFKQYFKKSPKEFYKYHAFYFVVMAVNAFVTYVICAMVPWSGGGGLMVRLLICLVIPNVLFFVEYRKTEQMKDSWPLIKSILHT